MKNAILFYIIIVGVFSEAILAVFVGENFPITLFQITLVGTFVAFVGYKLIKHDFELYHNDYALLLIIFLTITFLSLIYSADRVSGFVNALRFLVLVIFIGFLTNLITDRAQIIKGLILSSILCIVLATVSMGESLFNPEIAIRNILSGGGNLIRSAAGGVYEDPNRFAASLFIPIAFGFSLMNARTDIKYRIAGGLLFLLLLGGIISSYSRSGFVAVVVICLLNIFYLKRVKPFLLLVFLLLIVVFITPGLRVMMFSYTERIINLVTGNIDDSSSIRILLGIAAIKMFINSYGLGVGFDAFNEHFTSYFTIQESFGVVEPHNITYTVLAELGIHGFLIFAIIVFFLFRDALGNIDKSDSVIDNIIAVSLFSAFCGYVIFFQFYGGGLADNILMFNIGLILAHKKLLNQNYREV